MNKPHALVIGGTGMLAKVSIHLANEGYSVTVIARNLAKFGRLQEGSPPNSIFPLLVDYNSEEVVDLVKHAISERGSFTLIVCWTPNYKAIEQICEVNHTLDFFRLFHVKGSRRYFVDETIKLPADCLYHRVFLGFIIEESTSRWLTHEEISSGVIEQIKANEVVGVIGQIEPYEARPR